MLKWTDVLPYHWYYRYVLEADRIKLQPDSDEGLFTGIPYNVFVEGRERIVQSYTSTENQSVFPIPGYTASADNPLYVYIESARTEPSIVENGKFTLGAPISAGLRVTAFNAGVPLLGTNPLDPVTYTRPSINGLASYPSYRLHEASDYTFDPLKGEKCIVLGRSYRKIAVDVRAGETAQAAVGRVFDHEDHLFTIIDGTLYTSYSAKDYPAYVEYSFKDASGAVVYKGEDVIPTAGYVNYTDRFFPDSRHLRSEFFTILHKITSNLYYRFTDAGPSFSTFNERAIPDMEADAWYYDAAMSVLNEKYSDGCYVFPLYDDGTFQPNNAITRAETVMFLNRLIEWTSERFR